MVTRGRYYQPATVAANIDPALPAVGTAAADEAMVTAAPEPEHQNCVTCAQRFELAEFVTCPFHSGPICSVCCASENSCRELCKSPEGLRDGEPVMPAFRGRNAGSRSGA